MARRTRGSAVLSMAAVGAAIVLLAACSGPWLARARGMFGWPTPTPSATPRAAASPTPDVRATLVAEDLATQVAYSTALATRGIADPFVQTATPIPAIPPILPTDVILEPTVGPEIGQPESPLAPEPPPTNTLAPPAPALPTDDTPTPTPVVAEPPSPTPVAVATETPSPTATAGLAEAPPTATFTATPTPSVTPTFIVPLPTGPVPPTPTPPGMAAVPTTQFPAGELKAQVRATPAELYVGPSTVFTRLVDGPPGSAITLYGRDGTGEWVYMCCPPNSTGGGAWVRSAAVRPVDNPTPPGMPTTVSPNDVGRLPERQPPPALTPLPTPQPIPASDFPVFRRDRTLQGRVGQLPRSPIALAWPPGGNPQTPGFTSGVVVFGDNVVAAGSDNHIYSLNRESGSQRWRYNVGETVTTEPAAEGGWLYFVTQSGRLYELDSQGNASAAPWPLGVAGQPYEGIVGWGNRLFLTASVSGRDHLYMVDRINERVAVDYAPENIVFPHAPAVGNQLVYVAGSALLALDAFSNPAGASTVGEAKLIWRYDPDSTTPFTTSPVYSFPGVRALAELYVGDAQGRVWAFDANTGDVLAVSQPTPGQPVTMLAVNSRMVFAAGGGVVRALPRDNLVQAPWWVQPFGGEVNSLLAGESSVLASAASGVVQLYDASLGTVIAGNVNTTIMAGPPAVGGGWLFVAGTNGTMFGLREAAQ